MTPFPIRKEDIHDPLRTSHGEVLYELVGRAGGATGHSLAHVVVPPAKASLAHHHQVSEETYYVLEGRARMQLDGQEFEMAPGQACLILPGQVHQIFNAGDDALEFLVICAPAWYAEDSYYEE